MKKFRLYFDKDKETAFLNAMVQKGYAMTGFFAGLYSFDVCEPGKYIYQVDFTEGMFRVSNEYREFMQDMGVEIVALWGPWVILRKKAADGEFQLYTDVESSIEHYTRIKWMFLSAAVIEAACLFLVILSIFRGLEAGWAFFFIIGGILAGILREMMRINGILAELKGRAGGEVEEIRPEGNRKISGCLAAGLLLNGIVLMLPEVGPYGKMAFFVGFLKGFLQSMAFILMVLGCVLTIWKR